MTSLSLTCKNCGLILDVSNQFCTACGSSLEEKPSTAREDVQEKWSNDVERGPRRIPIKPKSSAESNITKSKSTERNIGDQLEKLAALHNAGSLSVEEFLAAKAKLLLPAEKNDIKYDRNNGLCDCGQSLINGANFCPFCGKAIR